MVGVTNKSDAEIQQWIDEWLNGNPAYDLMRDNCQKFVYELMMWVTGGRYSFRHRLDSSITFESSNKYHNNNTNKGFIASEQGNIVANYCLKKSNNALGPWNNSGKLFEVQGQAVAGPGLGLFVDATACEFKSSLGNVVGARIGVNFNTGAGIRNGNLEAHFMGNGFKVGADGVEINSPIIGVNACSIM